MTTKKSTKPAAKKAAPKKTAVKKAPAAKAKKAAKSGAPQRPGFDSIEIVALLDADPESIFTVWTDPEHHMAFTQAEATGDPVEGGAFTAYDGYIIGTYLELDPGRRIVQRWRTSEFDENDPDSFLIVSLIAETGNQTRLTLHHTAIPTGQGHDYADGWVEHYLLPLAKYLDRVE